MNPFRNFLSAVAKTMAVDALASGASYLTGQMLESGGMPAGLSTIMTAIVSGAVTYSAGKYFFKNEAGEILRECTEDELEKLVKGEVTDVADDVVKGGKESKILTTSEAEEYAFNAIKGPDKADVVVLGKYEKGSLTSYDKVAKDMGAQYFNLDNWDELSSQYSSEEIWKINERFLDIQTSSGREIYLSHDPKMYTNGTSYYSQEVHYLIDNGYTFIKEGDIWHAIG